MVLFDFLKGRSSHSHQLPLLWSNRGDDAEQPRSKVNIYFEKLNNINEGITDILNNVKLYQKLLVYRKFDITQSIHNTGSFF